MPYNNTPIAPSKDISGQVSLPLARVQKIINADPERLHTSKNAAFAIALATELFIQHFATTTQNVVKAETQKKPRRNVQYRDVATAVAKTDNLEFLVDVVPKTQSFGVVKKRLEEREKEREKEEKERQEKKKGRASVLEKLIATGKSGAAEEGEKAREGAMETEGGAEAMDVDEKAEDTESTKDTPRMEVEESEVEEDGAAMQIEMEMRGGPKANGKAREQSPVAMETAPAPIPAPATAPTHAPAPESAPARPKRSSGFTAINGSR